MANNYRIQHSGWVSWWEQSQVPDWHWVSDWGCRWGYDPGYEEG